MKIALGLLFVGVLGAMPSVASANYDEACIDAQGKETPLAQGQGCHGTYVSNIFPNETYSSFCVKNLGQKYSLEIRSRTERSILFVCHTATVGDIYSLYRCQSPGYVIRDNGLQMKPNGTTDDVWCQPAPKK